MFLIILKNEHALFFDFGGDMIKEIREIKISADDKELAEDVKEPNLVELK